MAPGGTHSQRPHRFICPAGRALPAERNQGPSGLVVDHRMQSQGCVYVRQTEDRAELGCGGEPWGGWAAGPGPEPQVVS